MAHYVFEVIAKYPQVQHIAGNMGQPAVHEHRRKQRQVNGDWRGLQAGHFDGPAGIGILNDLGMGDNIMAGQYFGRHGSVTKGKMDIMTPVLKIDEDKNVQHNQQVIDHRGQVPVRIVIANG